jgi:hypothetical protein
MKLGSFSQRNIAICVISGRSILYIQPPNGVRYPRVGGTRGRQFDGTNFKPRNLPENAATPTRRVHAVLGGFCLLKEKSVREEVAQVLL